MRNATRIERLTTLRDIMLNHDTIFPKVQLNMFNWANPIDSTDKKEIKKLNKALGRTQKKDCGTSACALGSAACYPPFKKKGLTIEIEPGVYSFNSPTYKTREGREYSGFEAGKEFFGISGAESIFLFDPEDYRADPRDGQKKRMVGSVKLIPIVPTAEDSNTYSKTGFIQEYEVANRIQLLINHYSEFKKDKDVVPLIRTSEDGWGNDHCEEY